VDYAAMPNTRHLDLLLPIMTGMIKANDEMAAEIKDGKYTTADDAKNAHLRLLNAVLRPAVHSGLRDSTQPATSGSGK
jgi:hypothetical protein